MRYSQDPSDESFFQDQPAEKSPSAHAEVPQKKSVQRPKKSRSDADRRVRQCERLARIIKVMHLISGRGRWDAAALAEELECSQRTIHRLLQTLSLAGVPWHFDEKLRTYRIRPGYKFPLLKGTPEKQLPLLPQEAAEQLLKDGEAFARSLQEFLLALKTIAEQK